MKQLIEYKKNVYSQNGEDGIIQELLSRLNLVADTKEKWCVEFGAWDGKHLSNTFKLVTEGWNAIYIEGDEQKYQDLLVTANEYPKITPVNAMVSFEPQNDSNLNNILLRTPIPADFELLSIDIDSYDLAVWQCFGGTPKIVIIEINSGIRPGIFQWHDNDYFQGNSFSSTLKVAKEKGYALVCHTGNLIFVRNDLISMVDLNIEALLYPETLFLNDFLQSSQRNSLRAIVSGILPKSVKNFIKRLIST